MVRPGAEHVMYVILCKAVEKVLDPVPLKINVLLYNTQSTTIYNIAEGIFLGSY